MEMSLPLRTPLNSRDIALIGVMTATIEVAKLSLSFLPNVELVTFLIILYTLHFKKQIPYVLLLFVLIEGVLYGFGLWWFAYLYIWPMIAFVSYHFQKMESPVGWAVLSGTAGLVFGFLCTLPIMLFSGVQAGMAYWIAGIPWDLVHGISNFILMLILFVPLQRVLKNLDRIWRA